MERRTGRTERLPVTGGTPDYPADHWLRSGDPETILAESARQQALAYSRVKNRFLWQLMGPVDGGNILDFGCGSGFFTVEAAKRGAASALGIDTLESCLSAARILAQRERVDGRTSFIRGDAMEAAADRAPFHAILLRDVLEHVENDGALIRRAASLLAPNGRLVLATQNARSANWLIEGAVQRLVLKNRNWRGWDPTHLRFYTPGSLARLLADSGLRPTAWRSGYIIPHKIPCPFRAGRKYLRVEMLARLDLVLGSLPPFNRLGWSLMVRSER